MPLYSFRAECQADVDSLREALSGTRVSSSMKCFPDEMFPDVEVELETHAPLETIRTIMRGVEDGHVMVETLRACALSDNSLERNYDL
jgi:hypothetical protein